MLDINMNLNTLRLNNSPEIFGPKIIDETFFDSDPKFDISFDFCGTFLTKNIKLISHTRGEDFFKNRNFAPS